MQQSPLSNHELKTDFVAWQAVEAEEVLKRLGTSREGLSGNEIVGRRAKYGKNQLEQKRDGRWWKLFAAQFTDILAQILLVAGLLALFFGEVRDAIIIVTIVLVNAIVGFLQEWKAERILDRMAQLTTDAATVVREGKRLRIDARELVLGDIVLVDAGARVPADGVILESYDCRVDGFIFSGESKPEQRMAKTMPAETPLADIENMLFMGESVLTGMATIIVVETGAWTQLGRLAQMTFAVTNDLTPLQKKMRSLGRRVAFLSLLIGGVVIFIGQYWGHVSLYQNFSLALALAVSVVPEGLPAAISVALALGMKRLLKQRVLAKKLSAVETLGSVTTICTDKTGTITRNELMVTRVITDGGMYEVDGEGYAPVGTFHRDGVAVEVAAIANGRLLFRIATLCNDASVTENDGKYSIVGDPTEGALIVAGQKYDGRPHIFSDGWRKVLELPFASERMRMSVVMQQGEVIESLVKGSPDILLGLATMYLTANGERVPMTDELRAGIKRQYDELSGQALRVLACAYRSMAGVERAHYSETMEIGLTWAGMLAMIDPPRGDVAQAVAECQALGLRVVMITGDYALTAEAIAKSVGLIGMDRPYAIISGRELGEMTDEDLWQRTQGKDTVFARIAPDQKLRIASVLQQHGEVIAMTGDGVNDAPALKKADIGVAMGIIGTDVSKEAADMILLNDNFASIVAGVKEGRTVYANVRKFVHYVFTSNVSELFTVVLGFILHIPAPILAVQILAIDLGTDVFPSFALGVEPEEPARIATRNVAGRPISRVMPKDRSVIDGAGVWRLLSMGGIMAVGAVVTFLFSLWRHGWTWGVTLDTGVEYYLQAASATYAVLAVSQLANLVQARSETLHPSELGWFRNGSVWLACAVSGLILWLLLHAPFFHTYLYMRPIEAWDWLMVALTTAAVYGYETWRKNALRGGDGELLVKNVA
jgi:Ca2+-transporting ATPase